MAELKRVRERIVELAGRPKNVTLDDIEWVVKRLDALGYKTNIKGGTKHITTFHVNDQIFTISSHNPGSKQLKRCYVKNFLNAMIELGLL